MRILIYGINYFPELTGAGKFNAAMAEWLAGQGHEVRVVTAPPYYPAWRIEPGQKRFWRKEVINQVRVWRCPLYVPRRPTGLKRLLHLASFALTSAPIMVRQILWRPQAIISVAPPIICAPTAVIVARFSRGLAWLHVQDFELDAALRLGLLKEGLAPRLARRLESRLLRRFDIVSTISNKMVERLIEKGVRPDRAILFPNWADPADSQPTAGGDDWRRELAPAPADIILLYAGNIGAKQGLELILEVADKTSRATNLKFVIAGEGAARRELEALAEKKALTNVRFLPLQPPDRFARLLAAADIHLVVQKRAAADLVLPSKVANIMAAGRPMIVTAEVDTELGALADKGGFALRVAPEDADALKEAIESLAADMSKREEMGQAARRYAAENLSKAIILSRLEAGLSEHYSR